MTPSASNAAVSCASIAAVETSGLWDKANRAAVPVANVGIDSRAMLKKITRLARFRSSLLATMALRNNPRPMIMPMVGK